MSLREHLEKIFEAERTLREAESAFLEGEQKEIEELLIQEISAASELGDSPESALRLERLTDLCAQIPSDITLELLLDILDRDIPSVTVQASEAMVDIGCDNYELLCKVAERAIGDREPGAALQELPWVVAEIANADAVQLIRKFLDHDDASIVASAVEALVSLGRPEGIEMLEPLKNDTRTVEFDEEEFGGEVIVTVGQLVTSVIS